MFRVGQLQSAWLPPERVVLTTSLCQSAGRYPLPHRILNAGLWFRRGRLPSDASRPKVHSEKMCASAVVLRTGSASYTREPCFEPCPLVAGHSVMLEEYARQMIYAEELHAGEVDKMLRRPGEIDAFAGTALSQ